MCLARRKGLHCDQGLFSLAPLPKGERIEMLRSISLAEERAALAHMRRCREAVGDQIDIATDVGVRYTVSAAIRPKSKTVFSKYRPSPGWAPRW